MLGTRNGARSTVKRYGHCSQFDIKCTTKRRGYDGFFYLPAHDSFYYIYNMADSTVISEKIDSVFRLSKKQIIFFEEVEQAFRADLVNFIRGETLQSHEGKITIGHNLYKRWLNKLRKKGIDYAIDCHK